MGSRAGVIALLIAAEVAIVVLAIYIMGGAHAAWASNGGMHHIDYSAKPIAPLSAGSTPHVVVNDDDDRIMVTASTDGLVHVTDLKQYHGTFWGTPDIKPLTVERTADGVSIARAPSNGMNISLFFSWNVDRIAIAIPPGSTLDIERSSGSNITGLTGAVTARSQDGSITLATLRGNVDAQSSDGAIEATDVRADDVKVQSADGHIELHGVITGTLSATTEDGHIAIDGLQITGNNAIIHSDDGSIRVNGSFATGTYEVSSDDGHIDVTVPAQSNLTVAASTGDGSITRDGRSYDGGDSDSTSQSFTLGGGSGHLNLTSHDGSISITTNGAT
jgi:hypothetical protein